MSFDLSLAGVAIPTDASALKSFRNDLNLAFALDDTFRAGLDKTLDVTLAQVPVGKSRSSVTYKGTAQRWNPAGGPVTFGFLANAAGAVEIICSGQILSYTDGLETQTQKAVAVPPGTAYVKVTLQFTLSGDAHEKWSSGPYGVRALQADEQTYAISFAKAFAPATLVRTALADAFTSFVLPFHPETLGQMASGDLLQYSFNGNLHLSFGAYAGLEKVLYAGQSAVDVCEAMGSKMATLSVAVKPEIRADASLNFSYQYASNFEVLLSRLDGTAHLHIFRLAKTEVTTKLAATLQFDDNVTPSVTGHQDKLIASMVASAGGSSTPAGAVLEAALHAGSSELSKHVTEVTDKLTAWFNKDDDLQFNLEVAIESTHARTILAGYAFDLGHAQYPAAWQAAIAGDLVAALKTGAVSLDAGSGLEQEYRRKTSCELNVFNLWHWQSWSAVGSKMQLVYAGDNRFHLTANVGRTTETDAAGTMRSVELYFAAEASAGAAGAISAPNVTLHVQLTASGEPKEAGKIAELLHVINGAGGITSLYEQTRAFAARRDAILQLHIGIPMQALRAINSDPPGSASTPVDAANWNAFAAAADSLPGAWALQGTSAVTPQALLFLKTYPAWQTLNEACNGGDKPDRTHLGNDEWPQNFPNVDAGIQTLLRYSMFAGQAFMNFCAALHDLAHACDTQSTTITWEAFIKMLTDAIKADTSTDFLRPTILALVRLCRTSAMAISGPSPSTTPTNHLAITIEL